MRAFAGWVLFVIGLGLFVGQAVKTNDNSAWWVIIASFVTLGYGLEMIIKENIKDAKEEILRELEQ